MTCHIWVETYVKGKFLIKVFNVVGTVIFIHSRTLLLENQNIEGTRNAELVVSIMNILNV